MPKKEINTAKLRGESYDYTAYLNHIDTLLEKGMTTGPLQTPELLEKAILNRQRMKRIEKTGAVPETITALLEKLPADIRFFVITEGWCGDAAQLTPYFQKMLESASIGDHVRYVLRDETGYIQDFLTKGAKSVPVIVAYRDGSGQVLHQWGPRPAEISTWYQNLLLDPSLSKDEKSYQLHARYSAEKGKSFFNDMHLFLEHVLEEYHQLLIPDAHP